jgi:hypothetical protein
MRKKPVQSIPEYKKKINDSDSKARKKDSTV